MERWYVVDKLKDLYCAVFDEKGEIKLCGRDACKRLIIEMKKYTSIDVGDEDSGFMNVENMKKEYKKITKEGIDND